MADALENSISGESQVMEKMSLYVEYLKKNPNDNQNILSPCSYDLGTDNGVSIAFNSSKILIYKIEKYAGTG